MKIHKKNPSHTRRASGLRKNRQEKEEANAFIRSQLIYIKERKTKMR